MIKIKIKDDFTSTPGARDYADGDKSGQEFYDTLLKEKFEEALNAGVILGVDLDGVEGYPSSFLSESFGLLGIHFGSEKVWSNLIITSNELPQYITQIKEYVFEKRKQTSH